MTQNGNRTALPEGDELSVESQQEASRVLQDPDQPMSNVVGFAYGIKQTDNAPTGEPALLVLVNRKMDNALLAEADQVPQRVADLPTDVVPVGDLIAQRAVAPGVMPAPESERINGAGSARGNGAQLLTSAPAAVSPELLTRRVRPCPSGFSIGNVAITAGTLGSVVYDFLPGAGANPPSGGIGTPTKYYVLSNNHVLANSNAAAIGSAILQPGTFDGGHDPQDRIATLTRFVPIQFNPPTPLAQHNNTVDCAIGECSFQDATREVYFEGAPRGWRRRSTVTVGSIVRKTGRTTNMSVGRVTAINATVDVNYGGGKVARFKDQILTTNMSAGGDSGSLVTDLDNNALGLLFAGSTVVTILNHFENVRSALRIEIAEKIV